MPLPNLPAFYDMKYTEKDGTMTHDSQMYNDQTFQTMNAMVILVNAISSSVINQSTAANVTVNGINPPSYTTAQIVALEPDVPNGTIWFNTTLAKLQVKTAAGIIETITSV